MRKQATQVDPQRAQRTTFVTAGGVHVTRTAEPFDPDILAGLTSSVDQRRGGVLSSGMEYPGRYSRWHLAYVDPCAEIVARGRRIAVRALNARGEVLLPVLGEALRRAGQPVPDAAAADPREVEVVVPEPSGLVAEEDRSRRPTVFTALREVIAAFAGDDPHLGLYGAFGYDLAFQFEPVRFRRDRPAAQRDLVLHLPDELYALDRKRESAMVYRYEFSAGGLSTEGLPRQTAPSPVRVASPAPGFVAEKNFRAKPQPGAFAQVVAQAKERFARGDLFEVVPSHVFRGECDSPAAFYETLRQVNPAPYEFFFNLGEGESLVGASPEMYVRVSGDRVETCPISGTIRRGADPLGDAENIRTLLNSAKEESELTMCTDVDRNDKSRVCRARQRQGDRPPPDRDVQPPDPYRGPHRGAAAARAGRAGRVLVAHVGGHRDRGAQDLGHAVHRGPRGRPALLVRRCGRGDRLRRQHEHRPHPAHRPHP